MMNFILAKALNSGNTIIYVAEGNSPCGKYLTAANERGIFYVDFNRSLDDSAARELIAQSGGRVAEKGFPYPQVMNWFRDYFNKIVSPFPAPIDLSTGTVFQRKVWEEVFRIPCSSVSTYSKIAHLVGTPSARAVGTANGNNPLPVIVPCHRVVRKDGGLGGYGYGIAMKIKLLDMEGVPLISTRRGMKVPAKFLMDES